MDEIETLLEKIRSDKQIKDTKFTANFLNDLADVYERHGPGVTKTYLLDKRKRRDLKGQADAALKVLSLIEGNPRAASDRRIGRLVFKTLIEIKTHEDRRQ